MGTGLIKDLLQILYKGLWKLIIAAIAGSLTIALINIYLVPPIYTSTSSIYIMSRQDESVTTYNDMRSGIQLTQDYMILITSRDVMEQVVKSSGFDISPDELRSMISIANPNETRILEISVTDIDPAVAKELVDAIVTVSSELLVKAMDIDQVNVIDYGNFPTEPTGQNLGRSFLSGGILGFVVSASIIIIRYLLNENIKSSDDIEQLLGITALGLIPAEKELQINRRLYKRRKKKVALES